MAKKKHLKVLFIGNSHTYYHDLPAWVALMAREEGYEYSVQQTLFRAKLIEQQQFNLSQGKRQ